MVLIKMKMPKGCWECRFASNTHAYDTVFCYAAQAFASPKPSEYVDVVSCPLVAVPKPLPTSPLLRDAGFEE